MSFAANLGPSFVVESCVPCFRQDFLEFFFVAVNVEVKEGVIDNETDAVT